MPFCRQKVPPVEKGKVKWKKKIFRMKKVRPLEGTKKKRRNFAKRKIKVENNCTFILKEKKKLCSSKQRKKCIKGKSSKKEMIVEKEKSEDRENYRKIFSLLQTNRKEITMKNYKEKNCIDWLRPRSVQRD